MLSEFTAILQICLYPILTIGILFILGFGITQLLIPKQLRSYSLWLSPWFAIIFIIIISVISGLLNLSIKYIIFFTIIVLISADLFVLLKTKLRYSFLPKEDIIIAFFVILNILFNLSPLITRDKFLTTISMGNNDMVNYVIASDDIAKQSLYGIFALPLDPTDKYHSLNRGGYRWGTGFLTTFFQSIFGFEAYQYINIMQAVIFAISIPLLYLLFKLLYKSNILGLILIFILMGFNANLLYMLYHNFFGQVLFWGLELFGLFFIYAYFSIFKEEKNKFNKYEFTIGISLTALYFSYHEGMIFVISPLIIFFLLRLILRKNILFYFNSLLRIFITLIILGSYAFFNAIVADYLQYFAANPNQPIGWELFRKNIPYANPFEMMGLYSIHSFEPLPILPAVSLSILTVIIMIIGYQKSKGKLLLSCYLAVYVLFLIWMGLLDHNFFTYNRALTYILPILLLLFAIGIVSLFQKQKNFVIIVFLIIIGLEMFSALKLNHRFVKGHLWIDKSFISLREISKANIKETIYTEAFVNKNMSVWNSIWINYFLYNQPKFRPSDYKGKVPDNSLILISKPKPGLNPPKVLLKNIKWENEYYKLGRFCNSDECLMGRSEDLSSVTIGKSDYEDSLLINGWSVKEPESRWAVGLESTLRLVNKKPVTRLAIETLTLKEPQEISVYIDDIFIGKQNIKTNWQEYSYDLQEPLSQGVHNILLKYSNIYRPVDLGISPDARELSADIKSIKFE